VPFPFVVGVTLLQPRKNSPVVVETLKRGDPPWHWLVLASVNDADANAWPATPDYWYSVNGARGFHTYCIPCFLAYYRERRVAKAAR